MVESGHPLPRVPWSVPEPSQGDAMTYLIHILGPGRDIVPVVHYCVRHGQLFASLSVWIRGY